MNVLRSKHVPVGTDAAGSLVALLSLLAPAASPAALGKHNLLPSQGFTDRENHEAKTVGSQPSIKTSAICYVPAYSTIYSSACKSMDQMSPGREFSLW